MVADTWHEVIESHYLQTVEGLFFAVKGLVHPPDRFLACLRYVPDPAGERQSGGRRYRRMYHFAEQEELLRARYPQYLAFDPICQATLQSVPRQQVGAVYSPRQRLEELRGQGGRGGVEEDCVALAALLQSAAGVSPDVFGVSGSLLIGLHTPGSDLDLTVYGREAGWAVQRALHGLLASGTCPELRRLAGQGVAQLYAERTADTQMAFADFVAVEQDKVNQGQFRGRPYFMRFVPAPDEAGGAGETGEAYGDFRYSPAGRAEIMATVTDASESIFTPCRYPLSDVQCLAGGPLTDLREVVSFRGRFCEQARAGDRVQAIGMVETVATRAGERWQRLLLGNAIEDTMVLRGRP